MTYLPRLGPPRRALPESVLPGPVAPSPERAHGGVATIARVVAALCAAGVLANGFAQEPATGQPKLPTTQIQAGMHLIRAEVADTPDTRAKGLMYRTALGANEGMLFVFEGPATHCFWMKNTRVPLSIAFIDDSGQIANIADMQPFDETSHCASRPVRFALEMDQGWFAQRGVKAGVTLGNATLFRAVKAKP